MYAKQKLYEAVLCLAGASPIEERLPSAALPLLVLNNPPAPDTPPQIQARLEKVVSTLTTPPVSDWPRPFPQDKCRELAEEIVSMYTEVMGGL